MTPTPRRAGPALAVLACFLAAGPAPASVVKVALVGEVRDEAKLFKPETVKEVDAIIRAVKRDHKKDFLVETYAGIPEDKKAAYEKVKDDKEKRNRFFEEWALERAKTAEVNGVYVLITKSPGHVQVEVGNETQKKAFTLKNRDHLRDLMLAAFKKEDFDKGLLDGAEYVRKTMDDNLKGEKRGDQPAAAPERLPPSGGAAPDEGQPSAFSGWLPWLCVGLVVVAIIWVVFAVIRALSGAGRGYGGPGYGAPGYGGGGGGGGFLSGLFGGLLGGAAGGWLYDRFFRGGGGFGGGGGGAEPSSGGQGAAAGGAADTDYSGTGGDFGAGSGDAGSGGDGGGGGDFGGDTGGGDAGGGDFGGGGDTGGGDFGGGGGDFGGGGGGDTGGGGDF